MSDVLYSIAGFGGAIAILMAYLQVSRHAWKPRSREFQLTNAFGAGLLIIYSLHISAWPNVLLNLVWLGVAFYALSRLHKR